MDIVIDTSALLAVIVAEPERDAIVQATTGNVLIGPGSIPCEVGNAFTAMLKQRRIQLAEANMGLSIFQGIPLRYVEVDMENALTLAARANLYAYDAYFLDCASRHAAPLMTLDGPLRRAAASIGIHVIEV
jgi:predicted nucleic acid-binding protein